VQPGAVTVLSDTAVRGEDMDEEKALEAKKLAEEALSQAKNEIDMAKAQAELSVMIAELAAVRRFRHKK